MNRTEIIICQRLRLFRDGVWQPKLNGNMRLWQKVEAESRHPNPNFRLASSTSSRCFGRPLGQVVVFTLFAVGPSPENEDKLGVKVLHRYVSHTFPRYA